MATPVHSFGIINSEQFFEKLLDDYKDFDQCHVSARYAMNCTLTAWHLSDWIYEEYYKKDSRFKVVQDFQNCITKKCPALQIL